MEASYDLSLSSEEVEKELVAATRLIPNKEGTGFISAPGMWARRNYWLGHPNLPSHRLENPLRHGELAAWFNPSSPLLLLVDPSLFEGLCIVTRNLSYYGIPADYEKLRELHPEAMQQALPPSRDHREL
jgi:hypothetical protein